MKPFLAKGYTKRKLHTGNQSVQFDEEREVERPLFYSTGHVIDGDSGAPVNGATVTLTINGVTRTTVTASNNLGVAGFYAFELSNFPNVQAGTRMTISATKGVKSATFTVPRAATSPQSADMTLLPPVLATITVSPPGRKHITRKLTMGSIKNAFQKRIFSID